MQFKKLSIILGIAAAVVIAFAADTNTFAQGRGQGGPPPGAGRGNGNGGGVDRGLGNASIRSGGRVDDGLGNASVRSNGRSDAGLDRARAAQLNARALSDNDLNRYRGLSRKLGTTPEQMRSRYEAALLVNPDLSYGQFVAANVVADNLNGRYSSVTSAAILAGMADGDSLGRTLRDLGVGKDEAKNAEKDANTRIKEAKRRN